jgi:predicted NBD/HSP70 family sugar kinase
VIPDCAAVVEVGGSGVSACIATDRDGAPTLPRLGALVAASAAGMGGVLLATPGRMEPGGLLHVANLGWGAVRLGDHVGLRDTEVRWVNDAAVIAAGERTLLGHQGRVLVLVFGTGLGVGVAAGDGAGPVMWDPGVEAAHMPAAGDQPCPCGRTGCLELLARAWVATGQGLADLAQGLSTVAALVEPDAVVLCGGAMRDPRRWVALATALGAQVGGLTVLGSAAPEADKSAAPHGFASVWPGAVALS